jgi:hypothetical protein
MTPFSLSMVINTQILDAAPVWKVGIYQCYLVNGTCHILNECANIQAVFTYIIWPFQEHSQMWQYCEEQEWKTVLTVGVGIETDFIRYLKNCHTKYM